MKIKTFSITNYRSIMKAYNIPFDDKITILVGKNNEGKSNVLKALQGCFKIIKRINSQIKLDYNELGRSIRGYSRPRFFREDFEEDWSYNWERDFPISKQNNKTKETKFRLVFELDDKDKVDFRAETGSSFNRELPFEIILTKDTIKLDIPKRSFGGGNRDFKSKIDLIAKFIAKRLDSIYIPAIRPAGLAVEIIEDFVDKELKEVLKGNKKYIDALKIIDSQQSNAVKIVQTRITKEISKFVPEIKDIKIPLNISDSYVRNRRGISEIQINDGVQTSIYYKGDGLKSLIVLGLMKISKQGNLTIAIEEPESHLHPDAIHKIQNVLKEVSESSQVIISTHSPIFVNRDNIKSNVIIAKNKAESCKNIEDIRKELGILVSDNLSSASFVLVVEGEDDFLSLKAVLSSYSNKIKTKIQNHTFAIDFLGGAGNLSYKLGTLNSQLCTYVAFLDWDESGKKAFEAAKKDSRISDKNCFFSIITAGKESEFEDFIKEDIWASVLLDNYGIDIKQIRMPKIDKWSNKITEVFRLAGKSWNDRVKNELKMDIAKKIVQNNGINCLTSQGESVIKQLITYIENNLN